MAKFKHKSSSRPSVMNHQFSQVPSVSIPRSTFNRTHGYKTTFDSGYLVPFYVDEALPGDTFNLNATMFARLATPIVPIMDNMVMETFYFAVPLRLIWDNFQKFMGEQVNPGDSTDYLIPRLSNPDYETAVASGSLEDYFGFPTEVSDLFYEQNHVSALWHRAYNLIWNEWFRDQNLQDSLDVPTGDGPDIASDRPGSSYKLMRRGKRHDYFTSALPWPQKGPGVELPLGDYAPIVGTGEPTEMYTSTDPTVGNLVRDQVGLDIDLGAGIHGDALFGDTVGLHADLSRATAATINSLRQAFQLQRLLERDARGGTRYTELVRSHFGVVSPDARLQRPEYLGGGSAPVNVSPVPQTSSTDGTTPQGNLSAFGVVGSPRNGFSKSFVEHSVIIGLVNVRADLTYQQGLPRMFSRKTKYDFYWPALAHLGEQTILNKEIYAQGEPADNDVFGYQERWAEYRYYPSKITGKLRSADPQSLDVWHLSQKFDDLPVLSSEFIQDNPPVDRVVAVPSEPQFILDAYIQAKTARPMPVYSVPGMIDHF